MNKLYPKVWPQPEPPLDPPDVDERTEQQILDDKDAEDAYLISQHEDRMMDDTPPDNWP